MSGAINIMQIFYYVLRILLYLYYTKHSITIKILVFFIVQPKKRCLIILPNNIAARRILKPQNYKDKRITSKELRKMLLTEGLDVFVFLFIGRFVKSFLFKFCYSQWSKYGG